MREEEEKERGRVERARIIASPSRNDTDIDTHVANEEKYLLLVIFCVLLLLFVYNFAVFFVEVLNYVDSKTPIRCVCVLFSF